MVFTRKDGIFMGYVSFREGISLGPFLIWRSLLLGEAELLGRQNTTGTRIRMFLGRRRIPWWSHSSALPEEWNFRCRDFTWVHTVPVQHLLKNAHFGCIRLMKMMNSMVQVSTIWLRQVSTIQWTKLISQLSPVALPHYPGPWRRVWNLERGRCCCRIRPMGPGQGRQ